MQYPKLFKAAAILAILIFSVVILVFAKPFLVPLTFGALLAMLLLPVTKWLQKKGVNEAVAALLSILLLVAFFALVGFFIGWQVSELASNATQVEQRVTEKYHQASRYVAEQLGIPQEQQQQMIEQQQKSSSGKMAALAGGLVTGLGGFFANALLVLVYIFLFIFFRHRLKKFVLKLVPNDQQGNAAETVDRAQAVVQKYLTGMAMMIASLWVMYSIGFSIAGVKNAFSFAVLCGLLEIVPFVGNITGTLLTLAMSLVQGGGTGVLIGILVTYGIVQFVQSYLLEPLVVGAEVSINPLFTIVGLVAGEVLWGIPGMILAIPLLGIAKIVCDHVEPLKPYAYLIGNDKKKSDSGFKKKAKEFGKKIKSWFKR